MSDPMCEPDELKALEALRDVLAAALRDPQGQSLAALSKEYLAVRERLRLLTPKAKESKLDELANRRKARGGGAATGAPAARRGQSRRSNGSHRAG